MNAVPGPLRDYETIIFSVKALFTIMAYFALLECRYDVLQTPQKTNLLAKYILACKLETLFTTCNGGAGIAADSGTIFQQLSSLIGTYLDCSCACFATGSSNLIIDINARLHATEHSC